jgi:hypothetical protein
MRSVLVFLLSLPILAQMVEIEGTYDYFQAMKVCSKKLGKEWRITEIWELFSLRGQTERFGKDKRYWSGNTLGEARIINDIRHEGEIYILNKDLPAYAFYLQDGDITPTPKWVRAYVICTNQPKIHLLDKEFMRQKDGSVVDKKSGVLWEPLDTRRPKMRYEEAREFCENLQLYGKEWRLPTLDELFGIVNYNYVKPTVNKKIFGPMRLKYYLTDDEFDEERVYVVGFAVGSVATAPKSAKIFFRCVSDLEEK